MQRVRGGGVGLGKLCVGERESISRETVLLAHNTELTVGEVGMPEKSILRNGQTMAPVKRQRWRRPRSCSCRVGTQFSEMSRTRPGCLKSCFGRSCESIDPQNAQNKLWEWVLRGGLASSFRME